jgi:hypothetical protein
MREKRLSNAAPTNASLCRRVTPHRAVGKLDTTYTLECNGSDGCKLAVARNDAGGLKLSPSDEWGRFKGSDVLLSRFQQGELSAPVLCAELLISSVMHDGNSSEPLVID